MRSTGVRASVRVVSKPVALARAFGKLIDSAVRYGGAARVGLSARGKDAVVTVEDDGPGIPENAMDPMLEPFRRGGASRSTRTGGAVLRLVIARAVIRSLGGALDLANRRGCGLRAAVRLPGTPA